MITTPDLDILICQIRSRPQLHLDDDTAHAVMHWWQRALGLDAWSIELRRTRGFRMGTKNGIASGYCSWTLPVRRATIDLLFHEDNSPDNDLLDDECTIVHELLHLLFAPLDDKLRPSLTEISEVENAVCIEQPIDWLANLLVALRRAPKGTKL